MLLVVRAEYWFIVNYVSIKRLRGGELYLVLLLLGAGFELLGRVAGLAILLEAGEELALADRLQIQIPVVVLAENVREPYYLPRLLASLISMSYNLPTVSELNINGYLNF